jgi:hypothetical protein
MEVRFGACEWALPGNGVASLKLAKEVGLEGLQLGFITYERGFLLSQRWFREYYGEECGEIRDRVALLSVCEFAVRHAPSSQHGKRENRV